MADDTKDNSRAAGAAQGDLLGAALSTLASGLVQPQGKPLTALELSELRALMATGTYRPASSPDAGLQDAGLQDAGLQDAGPQDAGPQDAGHKAAPQPGSAAGAGTALSATEIAAIKTRMLQRPYVPHPMPGDARNDGGVKDSNDG